MANPTCAPFTDDGLFVNRQAGETDEGMLDAVIEDMKSKAREGSFDNSDAANIRRIARNLEQMTGLPLPALDSFVDQKIANIQVARKSPYYESLRSNILAATQVVWERRAAGVQQMARSFLAQTKEGQDVGLQAIEFLGQLQSFNRLGRKVAEDNLRTGSALRQKLLAKGRQIGVVEDLGTAATREIDINPEYAANIDKNLDAFKEIAEQINGGDLAGGLKKIEKLAAQVSMVDDPRDLAGVISRWKSTWNTWDEVWINGLLSSTATFAVNVTAISWSVMRPMLQGGFALALAESGIGGAKFTKGARAAAAEAGAQLAAMNAAFEDALQLGWRAAKGETSILKETSQKITAKNFRENNILGAQNIDPKGEVARAIDLVGQIVRLPSRSMLGMDEFTGVMALRGEVAANGVRRAVLDNVDPTDKAKLAEYIDAEMRLAFDMDAGSLEARYGFNPGDVAAPSSERAANYQLNAQARGLRDVQMRAREAVFQEENQLARSINKLSRVGSEALGFAPLKPFLPFVTTPTNILKQGVWESTGADAVGKAFWIAKREGFNPSKTFAEIQKELLRDPAESARIGGQIAFMTIAAGSIYGMAMSGRITGGGPGQWERGLAGKKAQDTWIAQGNVPYAVDLGGGVKMPIGRLGEPFATPLRIIADLGYYSAFMDQSDKDNAFAHTVGIMSAGLFEASFLKGLDQFMRVVSAGPDNLDYEFGRGIQNYVATQMPFGSLLAQADRMTNPYKAAYEGASFTEMVRFWEADLGSGIFGKLLNRMPGFNGNPPLVDQITGEYVPITPGVGPNGMNPLLQAIPFLPRQSQADEVWDAVMEINGGYLEKSLGNNLKPTMAEQQAFNATMSNVTINGKTLRQAILEFRARPDVVEYVSKSGVTLRNSAIKKEFDRLVDRYRERARNLTLNNNPNIAERYQIQQAIKFASNANDVDTVKTLELQMDELVQRAKRGY